MTVEHSAPQESLDLGRKEFAFSKQDDVILKWIINFVFLSFQGYMEIREYLKESSSWEISAALNDCMDWYIFLLKRISGYI